MFFLTLAESNNCELILQNINLSYCSINVSVQGLFLCCKCEGDCGSYYKYVFGLELVHDAISSYISVSTVFSLISLAVKRLGYWLFFF